LSCCFTDDAAEARRAAMTAAILASSMNNISQILYAPFESLFSASLYRRDELTNNDGQWQLTVDNDTLDNEPVLFENLRATGWIRNSRALLYQPLMNAVVSFIFRKVKSLIAGDYETTDMSYASVLAWMKATVEPWLCDLAGPSNQLEETEEGRMTLCTAECYCRVRLLEIFEMVTFFPDSMPAVLELRHVLELTGMHQDLQQALRDSLVRRLMHPGADTSQLIDVYISTIKVLRLLDNKSGDRLLAITTEPVRAYLRGRSDTIRCIITSLTDADAGGDLYQELRRQDAKPLENVTADSDDEEECPTMEWQPPPSLLHQSGENLFGASSTSQMSSRGGGTDCDILAMLVSIYGSKELFVNEYRLMLADKLLANLDYNTDKEVHTLELLKLRFGEVSMVSAEVMIKDIDDSVRANKNIHDSLRINSITGKDPVVDAAMISHIFWPKLQNEQLKHHPRVQAELDDFGNVYAEQKNPRKLKWMNQLGTVQLELDVVEEDDNGESHLETKEFSCSPLLASLISHFEDKPTWTAEELSNETGIPERSIQKRMSYWITQRVVTLLPTKDPSKSTYSLSSRAERLLQGDAHGLMDDDEHGGQAVSASAQEEEEMEVYESYISVMLTSLQQASLERIHNMLHMMTGSGSGAEGSYNKTPQQLSAFLQRLCRQEKLECGPDGMYKLFKK
jgi:anaphase-promoting complex subunit 2